MFQVNGDANSRVRAIVASVRDGRVLDTVGAPAGPASASWFPLGLAGYNVLLKGTGVVPSGSVNTAPTQLAIASSAGGTHTLYRLPPDVQVLAPGTAVSA